MDLTHAEFKTAKIAAIMACEAASNFDLLGGLSLSAKNTVLELSKEECSEQIWQHYSDHASIHQARSIIAISSLISNTHCTLLPLLLGGHLAVTFHKNKWHSPEHETPRFYPHENVL